MEELLEPWVFGAYRSVPEYHLCGQGIGIQAHNVDEIFGLLEQSNQHCPVLQVLIRYVLLHGVDVESVMHDLANLAPHVSVFLHALLARAQIRLERHRVLPRVRISAPRLRYLQYTCPV